jgi:hypothetical protein
MSLVASWFAWVPVAANVRTRIAQGPLVHAGLVQWLEFASTNPAVAVPSPPTTNFRVQVYSAAPPWYYDASGTGVIWFVLSANPAVLIPPWDKGYPIWLLGSPWIEAYVTTDKACLASLYVP